MRFYNYEEDRAFCKRHGALDDGYCLRHRLNEAEYEELHNIFKRGSDWDYFSYDAMSLLLWELKLERPCIRQEIYPEHRKMFDHCEADVAKKFSGYCLGMLLPAELVRQLLAILEEIRDGDFSPAPDSEDALEAAAV